MDVWGYHALIDLHECDPDKVRSADEIRRYVIELCELIQMKRFGETIVVNFGENERVAGFSMTQLIETSLIAGHFVNLTNHIYMDIHSCKQYDPYQAAEFTATFFGAKDYKLTLVERV